MSTLRERRHAKAVEDISRLAGKREKIISDLVRVNAKLQALYRTVRRYERLPPAKPDKPDVGIPDFLQRTPGSGDTRDAEVRAEIEAQAEERSKAKARGRIAKMKAKQAGETKRMPLSGKAALDYINRGDEA